MLYTLPNATDLLLHLKLLLNNVKSSNQVKCASISFSVNSYNPLYNTYIPIIVQKHYNSYLYT